VNRRHLLALSGAVGLTSPGLAAPAWAQSPALPRIAYMSGRSLATDGHLLVAFKEGLKTAGYVDGQNVTIDVRWGDGHYDQVPALLAELIAAKPDVIAAVGGNPVGIDAKKVTSTIPVVFSAGADPVLIGLVSNLSRPDGNLTGITLWAGELDAKRLDLLRAMLPKVRNVALLMNPTNPGVAQEMQRMAEAAKALDMELLVLNAQTSSGIDRAFESLPAGKIDALAVVADAFLINYRDRILKLASARNLPAIFPAREFVEDGGLVSYGTRWADMYRIVGSYTGRILKGAKPGDLPVQRPNTYELVINLKTARALGLTVPPIMLARADEVIE
jgi:putative tryptophan/tyrosine transport system substrate-binding protein